MQWSEAKAIVTGGASGLGLAVVERIVAAGGGAAILDLQDAPGQAAAARLGATVAYVHCDVTNENEVKSAVTAALGQLGGLNLVVNCAGVIGAGRAVGREGPMPGELFVKTVHINLIGTFFVDKTAAALMQKNPPSADGERGLLIHTSSVAAFEGQIGQVAYSATKAGVMGMVLPLAREFAQFGIRVMAIAPGIFMTPMASAMKPDVQASLAAQVPFPSRFGKPEEYALLVQSIFENPMLNGETIRLDGAIRMQPK
ncbi:MAG TPA: SDR family NAD(P)-dependent oxidoreductase [Steroidobacteraceae bacterium]|nr:SDR family NAD(P)-dependent oxidoreductase [Steroidobacteraceae bacterium]